MNIGKYIIRMTLLSFVSMPAILAPVIAQETATEIRGVLRNADGSNAASATVSVTDTRTGRTRSVVTNNTGNFSVGSLRVGGPYTVIINGPGLRERRVEDVYLFLGDTTQLNLTLDAAGTVEEVVVTASRDDTSMIAIGPSAAFNLDDLQNVPGVNRDLKDVLKMDPRMYINLNTSGANTLQCGSANPKFNSLTIDGMRMNDNFGLNSNGYPTQRQPFPFDAIEQVSVELAPFDVQYGGFSACNINAVTKSGTNEFHGGVFYDYTSDSLLGDEIEGDPAPSIDFSEKRFGGSIGGPILQDRVFFFAAYEKLKGYQLFDRGAAGSGASREVTGVSQQQLADITRIARDVYGYDAGMVPSSIPVDDEKLIVKLDWNINSDHRAALTYDYNDGFIIKTDDSFSNQLGFIGNYFELGSELNSWSGQLFSDWSDVFSTELKIGYQELKQRRISQGDPDFGEFQITTLNDHDGNGINSQATVFLGSDDSSHANDMHYDTLQLKLAGNYLFGNHTISGGYELEKFNAFNLFMQEAEGEFRFTSLANYAAGIAGTVTYENTAFTNNKEESGKELTYNINTLYLQDEWDLENADLTLIAGLRYEWYTTGDIPVRNPTIAAAYPFDNTATLDGADLIQPRLGFTWAATEKLDMRGGIGRYSGGNPNVWIMNNYQNDGVVQLDNTTRPAGGLALFTVPFTGSGRPGWDVPQSLFDNVAAGIGSPGGVNLLDPDFQIPSEWKFAFGGTYGFENGYTLLADMLYTKKKNSAIVVDISQSVVGTLPDGRPRYANTLPAPFNTRSTDLMLTNVDGDSGHSLILSLGMARSWDFGLDAALGYAFTEAEDVNPMTSSVAFSNYTNIAVSDFNTPGPATSNYEIPHRFTLKLDYRQAFWQDYLSKFALFGSYNQGRPYSYVYTSSFPGSVAGTAMQLLYMPTGASDPLVQFGPAFNTDAFFAYAASEGFDKYTGQIIPRNSMQSDWWMKFDLKFEQELPGFFSDNRSALFFVIENVGNLLNSDWGVMREASAVEGIVNASFDANNNRYVYTTFLDPVGQTNVVDGSLWKLRLGVRYDF